MSVVLKIVLSALVVGGIGFGIWNHNQEQRNKESTSLDASASLSAGSTDDDLNRDMVTIDGQLNVIDQGSGEVDQSFDDQSTLDK